MRCSSNGENFYSYAPRGPRQVRLDYGISIFYISTHTPLAGRDEIGEPLGKVKSQFLLTRPSRGATRIAYDRKCETNISTHTPLAGRDKCLDTIASMLCHFYSHAPRGARPNLFAVSRVFSHFYSHAPREARRGLKRHCPGRNHISTHTPLAGRDVVRS